MLFSHRIITEPTNFTINNIKIEQVGEAYKEKFTTILGFHLDENLSWKYHIEEIRKKLQVEHTSYMPQKISLTQKINSGSIML